MSEAAADAKTKTVTFTAKDEAAAAAGFKALLSGGFYGKATVDGKDMGIAVFLPVGDKADVVTVKGVHVYCRPVSDRRQQDLQRCQGELQGTDRTAEDGAPLKAPIAGAVIEALQKGGFNGSAEVRARHGLDSSIRARVVPGKHNR